MDRNLDGYFFFSTRNGERVPVCWSDLTEEERYKVIENYDSDALRRFCVGLGTVIKDIGDTLDLDRK